MPFVLAKPTLLQVYCRMKPLDDPGLPVCIKVVSPSSIALTPGPASHAAKNGIIKESQYSFEFVFDENTSQKAVFEHIALPLVEDVLTGKNGLF
jgi:kinesin family protein 23